MIITSNGSLHPHGALGGCPVSRAPSMILELVTRRFCKCMQLLVSIMLFEKRQRRECSQGCPVSIGKMAGFPLQVGNKTCLVNDPVVDIKSSDYQWHSGNCTVIMFRIGPWYTSSLSHWQREFGVRNMAMLRDRHSFLRRCSIFHWLLGNAGWDCSCNLENFNSVHC